MMTLLTLIAILWGAMLAAFLALMIYRSHLTNLETDQLFLSDENNLTSEHHEQDYIVQRVRSLTPALRILAGALTLTTIAMVTLYLVQVVLPNAHLD
jgi:glycerol uptake facilitator-like aquaporin